jgi:hypothetical protein
VLRCKQPFHCLRHCMRPTGARTCARTPQDASVLHGGESDSHTPPFIYRTEDSQSNYDPLLPSAPLAPSFTDARLSAPPAPWTAAAPPQLMPDAQAHVEATQGPSSPLLYPPVPMPGAAGPSAVLPSTVPPPAVPHGVANPALRIAVRDPLRHTGPSGLPGLDEAYVSYEVSIAVLTCTIIT